MVKIGITGTRDGMTPYQLEQLFVRLDGAYPWDEFHHGDCIGVDNDAAILAKKLGYTTVAHPPINPSFRAFNKSDIIMPELDYFERNRNIVDTCNFLIVVPREMMEQPKGGTWYTYRYAIKVGKPFEILWPKESPLF